MTEHDELARLDTDGPRHRLSFTRFLPHPPEKVWRALTEAEHLSAWFPARIDGERRTGAALRFVFEHGEGPLSDGVLEVYEPPRLLVLVWGTESLRFELEPADGGTVLTFVNGFDELGKAARDAAGWHQCLERLAADLDGVPLHDDPMARWRTLNARYVRALGPEAATIGPDPAVLPDYA